MNSPQNFIDNRSESLWKLLSSEYNITTKQTIQPHYNIRIKHRDAVIYVPQENPSREGFVHELLHLFVRRQQAILGNLIQSSFRTNSTLKKYFLPELPKHIGSHLEHHKMLPLYLEMGFARQHFSHDYHVPKFDDKMLNGMKIFFKDRAYRKVAADIYVGKYFAMRGCPNHNMDYSKLMSALHRLDKDLFVILEMLWSKWETVDIHNAEEALLHSVQLSGDFEESLTNWVSTAG